MNRGEQWYLVKKIKYDFRSTGPNASCRKKQRILYICELLAPNKTYIIIIIIIHHTAWPFNPNPGTLRKLYKGVIWA